MSAGAHTRPGKILQCDWLQIERSQNYDPNRAAIYVDGEPARSTCNNEGWILVKCKHRKHPINEKSRNRQFGTGPIQRTRSINTRGKEGVRESNTLRSSIDAWNTRGRHLSKNYDSDNQRRKTSAMGCVSKTDPKARNKELIVKVILESGCG